MGVFAAAAPIMAAASPYLAAGALAATVATGVISARQQQKAGLLKQQEANTQARQEQDAARDREIERRRTLVRALSSQAAEAGAMGVASVGSRKAIAIDSLRNASRDSLADSAMTGRRAITLKSQGKEAVRQGRIGSTLTLLDTGVSAVKSLPGGK